MTNHLPFQPGPIAFFGSGETAPGGQKIFDFLFQLISPSPRVAILETPAGFELNSPLVAGNVGDFIERHLRNYNPEIQIVPARKKGTPFSPNDPETVSPILKSNLIFMGPGSPSYAVRQLRDSLAWEYILARHHLGAGLAFSSAATIAISSSALPVYEIYKVGQDLHWIPGLDFFGDYGLQMVFIPHWNNQDGGENLDTSRCYMGKTRFAELLDLLPQDQIIIGIDENTGLIFDFQKGCAYGVGQGKITILRGSGQQRIKAGNEIDLTDLGDFQLCDPQSGISSASWQAALQSQAITSALDLPDERIIQLAERRENARSGSDWALADQLRDEIESLGWLIQDNPDGYHLVQK